MAARGGKEGRGGDEWLLKAFCTTSLALIGELINGASARTWKKPAAALQHSHWQQTHTY